MPLYSTKYPIISDSPSGKSKGMRLVSARAAVTKMKNATGWVKMPQSGKQPARLSHQLRHIHRAVDHDHAEDGDAQGNLIGDQLRGRPQASEDCVVISRSKTGQNHSISLQRKHGEDVE